MANKSKFKKVLSAIKFNIMRLKYENKFSTQRCTLKYLYFPKENSKKLLVVFSGFPSGTRLPATYNYMKTFENVEYNRLYILDNFGPDIRGGSYYLGKNKDFFVEEAVNKLIDSKAKEIGVTKSDITLAGTSKGGYASLYFGFKYNYGTIICGGPQTLLGDYLSNHKKYFEYIAGSYNEDNRNYLNLLLYNVVKNSANNPNLYIQVGKEDHHYKEHVIPFVKYLDELRIRYNLDVQNYDQHSQVGQYFKSFALKILNTENE